MDGNASGKGAGALVLAGFQPAEHVFGSIPADLMRDSDVRDTTPLELAAFDFQPVGAFLRRQDAVGMRWRGEDRGSGRRLADHGGDLDGQGNKNGPAVIAWAS